VVHQCILLRYLSCVNVVGNAMCSLGIGSVHIVAYRIG
jgi:hypothetical protein